MRVHLALRGSGGEVRGVGVDLRSFECCASEMRDLRDLAYHDCEPLLLFFKSNVLLMVPEDVAALYCQDLCLSGLVPFGRSTSTGRSASESHIAKLPNISSYQDALAHNYPLTYIPQKKSFNTEPSLLSQILPTRSHRRWSPQKSPSSS